MPYPSDVKGLQRFLGMVNYLAIFIPNLSTHTVHLRKLLEKDSVWSFENIHRLEIDILKNNPPVLKFFDSKQPTKMSCDASLKVLQAVLEQKCNDTWYPVGYASRSLTSAERSCCQLDKEILSIVFACHRFHDFIYGERFYVFNDHLPLQSIFKRSILKAPSRIQRFLLRLQRYNFEMHYIQGKLLTAADILSRASLNDSIPEIEDTEIKCYVHALNQIILLVVIYYCNNSNDESLQTLVVFIQNGWPTNRDQIPEAVRPYYTHRQELTYSNGIIFKHTRMLVPKTLRNEMKPLLHTGHLRIAKTINRSKEIIYRPKINNDIKNIVNACEICLEFRNEQNQEPITLHDILGTP